MSWNELIAIKQEARDIRREDDEREVIDCPLCGTLLDENERGEKNCPLGHYRTPARQTYGDLMGR